MYELVLGYELICILARVILLESITSLIIRVGDDLDDVHTYEYP